MYTCARYYDSATGEFLSRDPQEFVDGMSLYRGYFVLHGIDGSGTVKIVPLIDSYEGLECGKPAIAYWDFSLENDAPCDGWIVQKISVSCTKNDDCEKECPCKVTNVKPEHEYAYFEAWKVRKDEKYPEDRLDDRGNIIPWDKEIGANVGKRLFTDRNTFDSASEGTCGSEHVLGEVRFYCEDPRAEGANGIGTGNLDELWNDAFFGRGTDCPKTSGDLPATTNADGLWARSPVETSAWRFTHNHWNCCSRPNQWDHKGQCHPCNGIPDHLRPN